MRFFYSLLVTLLTPFVLLYFAFRGLRDRAYLNRLGERFGFVPKNVEAGGILVHAASVGEFNAASPLIRALLKTYPGKSITVTSLTPTGSERVQSELGDKVSHCYIPLDLPGAVSRFLSRLQPQLIIVMETEIWPNLYLQAQRLNIPLMMANARLSQRSVNRFQRMPGFVRDVLQSVDWVGAQSNDDQNRLTGCGADPRAVELTGNLKFDLATPASLNEQGAALRSRWNSNRPVLVAGSTHEADESVVIPAFAGLLKTLPDSLLILVPRYPERFTRATQLAKAAGLRTELHSQGEACSEQAQCFVIDTIGELMTYYACGDVAFVGGSFGDQGGHNALEPAALGKPVLLGPNMDNAREIASQLLKSNAARRVTNQQDFRQAAEQILADGVLRDSMGQAGKNLVDKNKGALDLTLRAVEKLL
ncbi:MAG: lipid IV(A) 3-deoxy-D-manno-octulosonic acid transferase [Xanthomonadales bacterium]|nr:lipid IV(A) 3-deoxy-D-manno-octulosonic acid transferase [Xanthomonadales bacterium]